MFLCPPQRLLSLHFNGGWEKNSFKIHYFKPVFAVGFKKKKSVAYILITLPSEIIYNVWIALINFLSKENIMEGFFSFKLPEDKQRYIFGFQQIPFEWPIYSKTRMSLNVIGT